MMCRSQRIAIGDLSQMPVFQSPNWVAGLGARTVPPSASRFLVNICAVSNMPAKAIATNAASCQPFTSGASRMMASPTKQKNRCAQNTCRPACPMSTSGRIANGFITDWKRIQQYCDRREINDPDHPQMPFVERDFEHSKFEAVCY
jgi:hypothetical protein